MSDIQDLIYKVSMDCMERGRIVERERIIKLLEPLTVCRENCDHECCSAWDYQNTIALIKGENNE